MNGIISPRYERKVLGDVRKWVGKKSIIVVTGMRQVGKSTIMRTLFDEIKSNNKVFLDLENPLNQRILRETDYDNIWANLKPYGVVPDEKAYVFLDEIQLMPGAVSAIKYLFDNYDVQFFLTGSSSFYLKNLFPESLAGRKTVFELFPLDFEEFLWFKEEKKDFPRTFADRERRKNPVDYERTIKLYDEYVAYGGFPRVVLADDYPEKKAIIEDIYKSYFEMDVKSLADFRDIHRLQDCILLLMRRAGSKLNVSRLSSELQANRATVQSYISFLESTYFISLVPPYSGSVDREVSGAKKVYLCDTGMLSGLAQVSSGTLLENAVYNCLRRYGKTSYYQKKTGPEIDFILKDQGIALEVKETATGHDRQRLQKIADRLGLGESYVISKTYADEEGIIPATDL